MKAQEPGDKIVLWHVVVPSASWASKDVVEDVAKELAIEAWAHGEDMVLETYRYAPGPATRDEAHSHKEYQLCLSLDFSGTAARFYRLDVHGLTA